MAPYHATKGEIERFIHGKQSWIVEKISEKEKQAREAKRMFLQGEKFLYLGEWYPLEIHESNLRGGPL